MSQATKRRRLSFNSIDDMTAELNRLRRLPLTQRGTWTLPQACRHLTTVIEGSLTPPESNIPTPEQIAKREGFFKMVFAPEGLPQGMPSGASTPPAECTEADYDRFLIAIDKLTSYPHEFVKVGSCGPVPIADVIRLHLAHAAHHFSFQEPAIQPRADLRYADEPAAIADVELLRKGYTQIGNWTLGQMCWHMGTILKFSVMQPLATGAVDAQHTRASGKCWTAVSSQREKSRKGVDAPPQILPPAKRRR